MHELSLFQKEIPHQRVKSDQGKELFLFTVPSPALTAK